MKNMANDLREKLIIETYGRLNDHDGVIIRNGSIPISWGTGFDYEGDDDRFLNDAGDEWENINVLLGFVGLLIITIICVVWCCCIKHGYCSKPRQDITITNNHTENNVIFQIPETPTELWGPPPAYFDDSNRYAEGINEDDLIGVPPPAYENLAFESENSCRTQRPKGPFRSYSVPSEPIPMNVIYTTNQGESHNGSSPRNIQRLSSLNTETQRATPIQFRVSTSPRLRTQTSQGTYVLVQGAVTPPIGARRERIHSNQSETSLRSISEIEPQELSAQILIETPPVTPRFYVEGSNDSMNSIIHGQGRRS